MTQTSCGKSRSPTWLQTQIASSWSRYDPICPSIETRGCVGIRRDGPLVERVAGRGVGEDLLERVATAGPDAEGRAAGLVAVDEDLLDRGDVAASPCSICRWSRKWRHLWPTQPRRPPMTTRASEAKIRSAVGLSRKRRKASTGVLEAG